MKTDCDSEEVVMTENKDECSESWIQAMNSTEQMMIESISPPLLSLVTSDADLTIEETESPTNGKARELSLRMSGRASRQEDEIVQQQQAQLTETPVDEKTREENKERPATIMVDNESRTNTKSATMIWIHHHSIQYNHGSDECPAPRKLHCDNCERKGETTSTCPRCRDEQQRFICELEARRAKERAEKARQPSVNLQRAREAKERAEPERQLRPSTQDSNKAKERAEQEAIYRAKVEAASKANALEDEEKRRRAAAERAEELRCTQEGARTGAISKIKSIVVPVIAPGACAVPKNSIRNFVKSSSNS
ncbi:hypothetical protein TKK_0014630 [Trichogramma kaykai]